MIADVTLEVPVLQQEQFLVVDIMFIDQVSALVAVAYPPDLTFGVTLDKSITGKANRATEQVKRALDIILTTLKSLKFITTAIYSDGEEAIAKMKPHLNNMGIEVDISGELGDTSQGLNGVIAL